MRSLRKQEAADECGDFRKVSLYIDSFQSTELITQKTNSRKIDISKSIFPGGCSPPESNWSSKGPVHMQ